ncbi:MAG: isopenicillin N synthase family oxygenase [Bdellovibrionales bacterium]|nr:isopenicillin N synthase family oxygenase [Bdellovibrionales bacterium]
MATQIKELSFRKYLEGSATEKNEFTKELFSGLKECGFVILKDHDVSEELLDEAYEKSRQFFSLSTKIKESYLCPEGGGQRGYTPFGTEHAKDADVHDLKEFWHVGQLLEPGHPKYEGYAKNLWPKEVPYFQQTFSALFKTLENVGQTMLQALTPALDLPQRYFTDLTNDSNSILRLLHYPPIPEGTDPRCVRAAAHEDINLITILVAASTSGLELLDRQGQWVPVETARHNLIVDAGDMLSRITNEVIPSTTHRVVNPNDGENSSRYSMPFFMHPHPDAMLTCIESCRGDGAKYPDITSQEFLNQRLREIGLM